MKIVWCFCVKVLEVILCVAAFILKKLADEYSERVLKLNNKILMEWTLLNSISSSHYMNEFIILTIMGFMFISVVLLITRIVEKDCNYSTCEIVLLGCGLVLFTVQGLLLLAAVEELSERISYFAYSLSALSFMCAIIFSIDLIFFRTMKTFLNTNSQTDLESVTSLLNTKKFATPTNTEISSSNMCCVPKAFKKEAFIRTDL